MRRGLLGRAWEHETCAIHVSNLHSLRHRGIRRVWGSEMTWEAMVVVCSTK